MAFPFIGSLITPFVGVAKAWINGRTQLAQAKLNLSLAKTEGRIKREQTSAEAVAYWDQTQAEASKDSWKDEWFTIVVLFLIILPFCGEWGRNASANGFSALETAPNWFKGVVGIAVSASFGMRGATKIWGNGNGRKINGNGRKINGNGHEANGNGD